MLNEVRSRSMFIPSSKRRRVFQDANGYDLTKVSRSFLQPQGPSTACAKDRCSSSAVGTAGSQWSWAGTAGITSLDTVSGVFPAYFHQCVTQIRIPKVKTSYSVAWVMLVSVPTTLLPLEVLFLKGCVATARSTWTVKSGRGIQENLSSIWSYTGKVKINQAFSWYGWKRQEGFKSDIGFTSLKIHSACNHHYCCPGKANIAKFVLWSMCSCCYSYYK